MGRYDRLIIIDDEVELGEMLKSMFEDVFEQVIYFSDPEKAISEVLKDEANLIISDIKMPRLSGDLLVQKVRSEGILVPIIFLSGYVSKEVYAMALRLGVADVFDKPFNFDYMLASIQKVLEIERRKQEYYQNKADGNYSREKLAKDKRLLGLLHVVNDVKRDKT
jgi:DNA-binding NtrC family response regulator